MNIFDYPHIQEAIENVSNDLKYKRRACVVATMGIGKSAIAASTMLDYADKKIIFAAPRHLLLEQMQGHLRNMGYDLDKDFASIKFYTYAQLHAMIKKGNVPDFEFLVCDEFHAIAKKKQYSSIKKKLFTHDEDKYYLGLSATPILQWEYEVISNEENKKEKRRVNMASDLYDDNVSFFYSLDDAFVNGLFSIPLYDEFFVLSRNPREEAIEILKQRTDNNYTEEQVDALVDYLNREAGIIPILKKYLNLKNTKIMFYCRDFNDLLAKERLLKKEFPNLDIYKTSCRLPKKDNGENIKQFRNNDFNDGNSKVLLSIRQMTEGFHTDGEMQLVFGNKTKAYRDFLQKFGRGCSLGNLIPVKILDLGGNLTRISSLDFLNFRKRLESDGETKNGVPSLPNITFGGNIV
ncbi:MAG: DEAD/DEAH box helicase family protein, partial [Bacilli bacterium]|nr:DEAD/DEAH box helicase family protein [Bacilli bacterium]